MTPTAPPASDPESLRVQAMLTEYQYLRQESLQAISNRLTVMSFTFAAMSVIVAGLLTAKADVLTGAIAVGFLPQLSKAALMIWLGEYARSQRAGRFVAELETQINAGVGQDTLTWETKLLAQQVTNAQGEQHMRFPYRAVAVLLLGVGYAGAFLGGYFVYHGLHRQLMDGAAVVVLGAILDVIIVVETWFLTVFVREFRKAATGTEAKPNYWRIAAGLLVATTVAAVLLYGYRVDQTVRPRPKVPAAVPAELMVTDVRLGAAGLAVAGTIAEKARGRVYLSLNLRGVIGRRVTLKPTIHKGRFRVHFRASRQLAHVRSITYTAYWPGSLAVLSSAVTGAVGRYVPRH